MFKNFVVLILFIGFFGLSACTKNESRSKQQVRIDGSSTVYPITEAMAEEFSKANKVINVTVGVSGTGGGFKKFLANEIDINDASRTIKSSEVKIAQEKGIQYLELPVAYDGISIVVHPDSFLTEIKVSELKKIWESDAVSTWKDVNPNWPDRKIKLYGPGTDSGTFDYFKEVIVGKKASFRSNYTKSEDDNMLVKGVAGDKDAMGFFGYAYYESNKSKLRALAVAKNDNSPAIAPDPATIQNGSYSPLSRPVFIYVNKNSTKKAWVNEFVKFYLNLSMDKAAGIIKQVGYIPLNDNEYKNLLSKYSAFMEAGL